MPIVSGKESVGFMGPRLELREEGLIWMVGKTGRMVED